MMKKIILVLILFSTISIMAQPSGYLYNKQISIENSQVEGSSNLSNFPVLINITDSDLSTTFNGGHIENFSGYDIVFTGDDETSLLDFEIESYDGTTGQLIAWVKVPSVSPSSKTVINMYYGNSSIISNPSSEDTWTNNFNGVWHLNQDPSSSFNGSTNNNISVSSSGAMTNTNLVASQISSGLQFDGINDYLTAGDNDLLDMGTNDITLSAWIYLDNLTGRQEIINKKYGGSTTDGYALRISNSNLQIAHKTAGNANVNLSSATILTANTWIYASVVFDNASAQATVYINGVAETPISINTGTSIDNSKDFRIGDRDGDNEFGGMIDEARVAGVSRSADWLRTEYNNQSSPSTFISLSAEKYISPLPIQLLSFNAEQKENNVELKWTTASELNNDYFTIERSSDGENWNIIATITGAGNSNQILDYSYTDYSPLNNISYYRLKQTDFDGAFEYSDILIVNYNNLISTELNIYPNPATDYISIESNTNINTIVVYNALGQDVTNLIETSNVNTTSLKIDISNLKRGIYYVKVGGTNAKIVVD